MPPKKPIKKTTPAKPTAVAVVKNNQEVSFNQAEALISQAIANNTPVETLERLLVMRRELKAEWAKEQYDIAMAKLQGEMPIIQKSESVMNKPEKGGKLRYKFAPIDKIVLQSGPVISKNGFSYMTNVNQDIDSVEAVTKVTHICGHSDNSAFRVPIEKDAFMTNQQKYASAQTYAKRYSFCNAFGIMTGEEDDDSNANAEEAKPAHPAYKPSQRYAKPTQPTTAQATPPTQNQPVKAIIPDNERIMIALKKLGYEPKLKEEVAEVVKNETGLDLEPRNYKAIIIKLENKLKAPKQAVEGELLPATNNQPQNRPTTAVAQKPAPAVPQERISPAQANLIRSLASQKEGLTDDTGVLAYIKYFHENISITVSKLEELSKAEAKAVIDELMKPRLKN
jgi:hypothetical protein